MGNCPTVSQRIAPGHLFISLFARRQCSRLWRRNSIFILSFSFFSPLRISPHFPPNYYLLLFSPRTCSSFFLTRLLCVVFFLTTPSNTSVTHAKKIFNLILLASCIVVWVKITLIFNAFKSVITSGIIGKCSVTLTPPHDPWLTGSALLQHQC